VSTEFQLFTARDHRDDLVCGHDGACIVWKIDLESGVHLFVRVIRRGILHHRDLVPELGRKANGRLHTGVRDESNDDELLNTAFLELKIEIRTGETTGTPMLGGYDIARARLELGADFATPRLISEGL